jgi:hypothetical protein
MLDLEPLTREHLQVIAYIEKHWFKFNGHFPSKEALFDHFPDFDINTALKHKTFRVSLMNRGIDAPVGPLEDELLANPKGVSREQLAAIITVINFEDKRSRLAKFKELGITAAQWQGWLKQESFKTFLQEMSAANLQDAAYVANEALIKAMDRGDVNAIKFYSEITGKYTQQHPQMQNIKIILARVIESIQRHIKDPEVLLAIGRDFEAIMAGTTEEARQIANSS